jgi:hypothetical protein
MASIVAAGSGFPGHDAIRDMSSAVEYGEGAPGEGLVFRDVNSLYSFKAISLDYKN